MANLPAVSGSSSMFLLSSLSSCSEMLISIRENCNHEGKNSTKKQIHKYTRKYIGLRRRGRELSVLNNTALNRLHYVTQEKKIRLTEVTWRVVCKVSVEFSPMSFL